MASTAGDESSRPPSSSSPPPTTAESSQSAPQSPSAAVYTLYTEQPLDGGDGAESHHLRILASVLGSEEVAKESLVCVYKTVVTQSSAKLTPEQVLELSKQPGVLHVADGRKHPVCGSKALDSKVNCSAFFKKCYELSEEPDNLDVQDLAREQLARLVLDSDQTAESSSLMSKAVVTNVESTSKDMPSSASNSNVLQLSSLENAEQEEDLKKKHDLVDEAHSDRGLTMGDSKLKTLMPSCARTAFFSGIAPVCKGDGPWPVSSVASASAPEFDTSNSVSSKLSAVSEAIRSLRCHLRSTEPKIVGNDGNLRNKNSPVCKCRNTECIKACDIKEWIQKVKQNRELWKLTRVLLESCMALGEACKEVGQMHQAVDAVQVASSLCTSITSQLESAQLVLDVDPTSLPRISFRIKSLLGDVHAKDYSMRQVWEIHSYERERIRSTFSSSSPFADEVSNEIVNPPVGYTPSSMDGCLSLSLLNYELAISDVYKNSVEFKEMQAVRTKLGWVRNELGRRQLENKNFPEAVAAFLGALEVFEEVSDCTNVVVVNCNLGYARRALAEKSISNIEQSKNDVRLLALELVKMEYVESLRYYHAAMSALPVVEDGGEDVPDDVRKGVCTQLAQTYLKLGMFLSREGIVAFIDDFGGSKQRKLTKKQKYNRRQHEISAEDSVSEALSLYDSLGELGKQDAADAYFQLGCHQNGCYWNIIDPKGRSSEDPKMETGSSQVKANEAKQLAEEYWQKTIEFYSADAYPDKYLEILVAWSTLSFNPSSSFHSDNKMLESALDRLLDGLAVSSCSKDIESRSPKLFADFRKQLQGVLHKLCQLSTKSSSASQANLLLKRSADEGKLRKLYLKSLYFTDLNQLQEMHQLWNSE